MDNKNFALWARNLIIENMATSEDEKSVSEVACLYFIRIIAVKYMQINGVGDIKDGRKLKDVDNEADIQNGGKIKNIDNEVDNEKHEKVKNIDNIEYVVRVENMSGKEFTDICRLYSVILPGFFYELDKECNDQLISLIDNKHIIKLICDELNEESLFIKKGGSIENAGWLFQHFNTDDKSKAFNILKENKKIPTEYLGAATQLFTPKWVVEYMVDKSLGKWWTNNKNFDDIVDKLKSLKIIDPCVGSGNILLYVFEVLMNMYNQCGVDNKEAVRYILEENIYGLDIDDRACEIAYFSIMMKAVEYGWDFDNTIRCNIRSFKSVDFVKELKAAEKSDRNGMEACEEKLEGADILDRKESGLQEVEDLIDILGLGVFRDASDLGSLMKVEVDNCFDDIKVDEVNKILKNYNETDSVERYIANLPADIPDGMKEYIKNIPTDIPDDMKEYIDNLPADIPDGMKEYIKNIPADIPDGMKEYIKNIPADIPDGMKEYIKNIPANIPDGMKEYIKNIPANIQDGVKKYIKYILSNMPEGVKKIIYNILEIVNLMNQKYDFVITNPPYMGKKNLNNTLSSYLEQHYPLGKSELYAAFILRCIELAKENGYVSMITIHSWMFIKSYEKLREHLLQNVYIQDMLHLGAGTFDELNSFNVLASAFVIKKQRTYEELTEVIRLTQYYSSEQKREHISDDGNRYIISQKEFLNIPEKPFVYWVSKKVKESFRNLPPLKQYIKAYQGMATSDNGYYVRMWHEVDRKDICFDASDNQKSIESGAKWFPYNKGGNYRKWYGMNEYVVNWENGGEELKNDSSAVLRNKELYFKKGITWSLFGFENFGVRYKNEGFLFDVSGSSIFPKDEDMLYILAFLASNVAFMYLSIMAPTVNFQVGNIENIPFIIDKGQRRREIEELAKECIELARKDWDSMEVSWDFEVHPMVEYAFENDLEEYLMVEDVMKSEFEEYLMVEDVMKSELEEYLMVGDVMKSEFEEYLMVGHTLKSDSEDVCTDEKADTISLIKRSESSELHQKKEMLHYSNKNNAQLKIGKDVYTVDKQEKGKTRVLKLEEIYSHWKKEVTNRYFKLKKNEERINELFIQIYGLEGELSKEVSDRDMSVKMADEGRSIRSLISYIVGLIYGRFQVKNMTNVAWNTDSDIYNQQLERIQKTLSANNRLAKQDGIIILKADKQFDNDIVSLFEKAVSCIYGEVNFEENMKYIAAVLGGENYHETLRKYFVNDFFKDHVKMYKKRPLYWEVSSTKDKSFKCLVYMKKFDKDTWNKVLWYMTECGVSGEFYDAVRKLAKREIEIELDDGVKVNYEKAQGGERVFRRI